MYSLEEGGGDLEKIFSDDSYTAWMKRKHKAMVISHAAISPPSPPPQVPSSRPVVAGPNTHVLYLIVMWALVYPFSWTAYL
jgi:hypothetical protein